MAIFANSCEEKKQDNLCNICPNLSMCIGSDFCFLICSQLVIVDQIELHLLLNLPQLVIVDNAGLVYSQSVGQQTKANFIS